MHIKNIKAQYMDYEVKGASYALSVFKTSHCQEVQEDPRDVPSLG